MNQRNKRIQKLIFMKKLFSLIALGILSYPGVINAQGHFKIRNDEFI